MIEPCLKDGHKAIDVLTVSGSDSGIEVSKLLVGGLYNDVCGRLYVIITVSWACKVTTFLCERAGSLENSRRSRLMHTQVRRRWQRRTVSLECLDTARWDLFTLCVVRARFSHALHAGCVTFVS